MSDIADEPLFIIGCTGCGKGALARALARRTPAEIISVDSMKVYRRMDIGTAKPGRDVRAEIPHHLIDVVEPSETFSAARFVELAEAAVRSIAGRGHAALAVGGTTLYLKAWTEGLFEGPSADPAVRTELHARAEAEGSEALHAELARVDGVAAARIHRNDVRRIVRALEVYRLTGTPISRLQTQWEAQPRPRRFRIVGLRRSAADQTARIHARIRRMIDQGLVEEVRALLAESPPMAPSPRQALGYAEVIGFLEGQWPLEQAVERIKINTRQFAKAQRTWFRRLSVVHWIDLAPDDTAEAVADRIVEQGLWPPRT